MIVVMQENASELQVQNVMERLVDLGFDIHRSTGVTRTVLGVVGGKIVDTRDIELLEGVEKVIRVTTPYKLASRALHPEGTRILLENSRRQLEIGQHNLTLIAGPCVVESQPQMEAIAEMVAANSGTILRGGTFRVAGTPYSHPGLGEEGLRILREAADHHGLFVISEIAEREQIPLFLKYTDIIQVGARNMQNFTLLKALGKIAKPVLLKRGISATVEEWLISAEHILAGGNHMVMLCERGIRTFESVQSTTLDLAAIPVVQKLSHLPLLVDPSHGTGRRDKVIPMARAAVAAGADGLMLEVHPQPERALSDGAQSLEPVQFRQLVADLARIAPIVGRKF
jgi:3-deoxy-7-phosphoheptulonate synthase